MIVVVFITLGIFSTIQTIRLHNLEKEVAVLFEKDNIQKLTDDFAKTYRAVIKSEASYKEDLKAYNESAERLEMYTK